jgi:hypothetical protein
MTMTKLSDLKSADQIAAEELRDPEVAAEFERTAVAEQVALLLTAYRVEHGLTQTGLAKSAVARFEAGGTVPSLPVLTRVARALYADLVVQVTPRASGASGPGRPPSNGE